MLAADVVIGAGFGDEGKGLATDALCAGHGTGALVVRFNGGAQAGHTVQLADGTRHIFHHIGSGTFAGAATLLSRFFVCNPLLLAQEWERLAALGVTPVLHADGRCPISTPYDMMLNQMAEEARGDARHGSCGAGFGETLERQNCEAYALTFDDLENKVQLRDKLQAIRTEWVPARLAALGIKIVSEVWVRRLAADGILEYFMTEAAAFLEKVRRAPDDLLQRGTPIVFEGAQGLMLDQDKGWFPHVTRSNTGLRNVRVLAEEAGIGALNVHYMTRTYTTRHGAGPMRFELPVAPYAGINDPTNIPNQFQGTLRFGWLDLDLLAHFIGTDIRENSGNLQVRPRLGVSCLDQVGDEVTYVRHERRCDAAPEAFLQHAMHAVGAKEGLASYGPTRATLMTVQGVQPTKSVRKYKSAMAMAKPCALSGRVVVRASLASQSA